MSLRPSSFEAARASYKPMKRGTIKRGTKRLTAKKRISKKSKKKISKDKVWKEFSIYIRTRGADSAGFNTCVTCGQRSFWRDLQAGHFLAGRLNANIFDERGVWPQCRSCNVFKHGAGVEYCLWMQNNHGQEIINELIAQNNQTVKWPKGHLEELYQKYAALNAENPLVSATSDS